MSILMVCFLSLECKILDIIGKVLKVIIEILKLLYFSTPNNIKILAKTLSFNFSFYNFFIRCKLKNIKNF